MEGNDKTQLTKARTIVYRLLKFRPRSETEIREKLKAKGFGIVITEETISYFKEIGGINDRQFARGWIAARLMRTFGTRRILHELKNKGVSRNVIEEELADALGKYKEEDIVFELAKRRMEKYTGVEPIKAKARLAGFLSRRGFNNDVIYNALKRIK